MLEEPAGIKIRHDQSASEVILNEDRQCSVRQRVVHLQFETTLQDADRFTDQSANAFEKF